MIEFEHPPWLWGLLALAVPVLLHLFARRSAPPEDFPPAVLLEKDARRAVRVRKLKELLRLLVRVAALAAAVLCFARPRLAGSRSGAEKTVPVGLVVVLDDSLSMSRRAYPGGEKSPGEAEMMKRINQGRSAPRMPDTSTRRERALDEGRAALEKLGPGSEAAVVFASGRSLGPDDPGKLAVELKAMRAGGAKTSARADMNRALDAAPDFLEAMKPLEPAVLVLGDCEEGSFDVRALARHARLAVLDLGAPGVGDDWALLGARLDRRRLVAGESAHLLIRVSRAPGKTGAARRRIQLILGRKGGRKVAVAWREVSLAPGSEVEVPLRFTAESGARLGELRLMPVPRVRSKPAPVRLPDLDPWPVNDRLPVALAAHPPARIAVICRREDLNTAGRAVRLALSAGPGAERKAFLAETLAPEPAALADLTGYRAFVLIGPPKLDRELSARLARRVAAGAGAVVFAEDPAALAELAGPLGLPVPPAAARPVDFATGAYLLPTRAGAGAFAPFRAAAVAPVFRRALALDAAGAVTLARLRSRRADLPGVIERHLGRGPVIVVASGPGARCSRLAAREHANLFVPLTHELVARAAGLVPSEIVAEAGGAVELATAARERSARFWLSGPAGLRTPLGSPDSGLRLHLAAPSVAGAYRLLSEADGKPLAERALAVRLDPRELSGRRLSPEGVPGRAPVLSGPLGALAPRAPRGRELAPLLAGLALGLLFVEMLASFLATGRRAQVDSEIPASRKRGRVAA